MAATKVKKAKRANDIQIGGDHYKMGGEEHWDRMWRLYGRGYFVGCVTKLVERYPYKNGLEDLQKAGHFIQKLIELEQGVIPPGQHYREQKWPLVKKAR
jgi:uncharacterized protein DUF3310